MTRATVDRDAFIAVAIVRTAPPRAFCGRAPRPSGADDKACRSACRSLSHSSALDPSRRACAPRACEAPARRNLEGKKANSRVVVALTRRGRTLIRKAVRLFVDSGWAQLALDSAFDRGHPGRWSSR
jgi:hypothetical protein